MFSVRQQGMSYIRKCQGINSSLIIRYPAVHPNIPEQIKIAAAELQLKQSGYLRGEVQ